MNILKFIILVISLFRIVRLKLDTEDEGGSMVKQSVCAVATPGRVGSSQKCEFSDDILNFLISHSFVTLISGISEGIMFSVISFFFCRIIITKMVVRRTMKVGKII